MDFSFNNHCLLSNDGSKYNLKMALKDWKKKVDERNEVEFVNKKGKKVIIEKERDQFGRGWIWTININPTRDFDTKKQVLKFARQYMRKH